MIITITPFALVIFFSVIGVLYKYHFLPYLSEKGKNLATKEDVGEITKEIASVNHRYNSLLEELKGRHQLRLAAVDKRLQVHQEAFTIWRKMLEFAYGDEIGKVVLEAQSWWEKNCIYLEPEVRQAFVDAYSAIHTHGSLVSNRAEYTLIQDSWQRFTKFPNILFESIKLPALTELEAERIKPSETK